MNFESFEYQKFKTEKKFRENLKELHPKYNKKSIYYLIKSTLWKVGKELLMVFKLIMIITGSNANMLSGELAALLSERYIEIPIYPLSFQ